MGEVLWLTGKLAGITTVLLLLAATPLSWWLARGRSALRTPVTALVALPIVLPPTVLGFYLLIALGPKSPLMVLLQPFGVRTLAFTFEGLVIGSLIYSLPFAVQPLRNAFLAIGDEPLEAAACLGASPWQRFWRVALPLSIPGYVAAAILGASPWQRFWRVALPLSIPGYVAAAILVFAHTVGEFGVVMMLGGNIPGETTVLSTEIYRLVEALEWGEAHRLSLILLAFAFAVLFTLLALEARSKILLRTRT